jgi:type II secretory ATPase GspE/PulE/Tfp pilus assembly ATPase PilB-like protein
VAYLLKSEASKLKEGVVFDPLIFLVDRILYSAISMRASDIHLEQRATDMRVRYRIDGILYDQASVTGSSCPAVLSRLKILSSLDIAQKRLPQDGKFCVSFECENRRDIDLRVSTFPSIYGEKMVIRILDRNHNFLSLENLGFSQDIFKKVTNLMKLSHGFFIVTGPTGSGKSTTLYAILSKLNTTERNIVTMEDPVEYHIDGITQSQIDEKSGFTFERGLRSLLRQDPDVIMVGEIRDRQTAQISVEAALTGHLVFTTLHTKNAIGAVTRLLDMGIEPFLLASSLSGVLAQKLVRKKCPRCRDTDASRCEFCAGLGHRGRSGVFELLVVDDHTRSFIRGYADMGGHASGTCSKMGSVVE